PDRTTRAPAVLGISPPMPTIAPALVASSLSLPMASMSSFGGGLDRSFSADLTRVMNRIVASPSVQAGWSDGNRSKVSLHRKDERVAGRPTRRTKFFCSLQCIPALLLRRNAQPSKAVDGVAGGEIFQLVHLADFDSATLQVRIGHAFRPFQGFFPRLHLDDRVAGDELLGLGKGAVVRPRHVLAGLLRERAARRCPPGARRVWPGCWWCPPSAPPFPGVGLPPASDSFGVLTRIINPIVSPPSPAGGVSPNPSLYRH